MKITLPRVSYLALILFGCWANQANAQTDATPQERLDFDIKYLASDELEGREPGTKGIELAADYIIDTWKEFNVPGGAENGGYRQDFEVNMGTVTDKEKTGLKFTGGGEDMIVELDSQFQPMMTGGSGKIENAKLVFAGYGITADDENYDDFKDLDCEGKVVVVIRMEPQQKNPNSVFAGSENSSHASISRKLQLAKDAGAVGLILVNDGVRVADSETDELAQPSQFGRVDETIPFFHVKREVMDKLLAKAPLTSPPGEKLDSLDAIEATIDGNLEPISQELEGVTVNGSTEFSRKSVVTSNIVGVVEGEGPNADETIIIGGHYDHLGYGGYGSNAPGRREVHNGADDNATGTAGLVELARRFANADKKPGRRLVFIAFSGEERGLLGSFHYVEQDPLYPLDKTVAMVNYDMIGRLRDAKLTIFGAGTGDNFGEICDNANTDGLDLNKVPSASAGSDHMAFARKDIPVMFLHTGLTNIYHTPEDDYETLNIEGANRVVDYTERLLRGLADAEAKPKFVRIENNRRRTRRPSYLGVRLDYEADERGPRIEEAPDGAPAAAAGLKAGDVVLTIAGEEVNDAAELTALLTKNRPGSSIDVVIMRGDKEMTVKVELARTPRRSRDADKKGKSKGNPKSKSDDNKKDG